MTKPQALRRKIEEYVVIDRCNFGVINMTMPPFFSFFPTFRLTDDQLDRVNDRRGKKGHKNGVE